MNLDQRLSKSLADAALSRPIWKKIADTCAMQLLWLMGGAFLLSLYFLWREGADAVASVLFGGVFFSWMTTLALEYAIGRPRPFQREGKALAVDMLWVPPSFPSGHATLAFAIAAASVTLHDVALTAAMLGCAALVSFGRVAVRVHYLTDVAAGAVVGTVVTSLFIRFL